MEPTELLAIISRDFLQSKNIYQYRMKKITDMTDDEIIGKCHCYCENNGLIKEWNEYRDKAESEYYYCDYLEEYIDEGSCYNLQMIAGEYIKQSNLPEISIDKEKCTKCCFECKYRF